MAHRERKPETPPLLHGDGVTDDTEAIQWHLDHDVPFPLDRKYRVDLSRLHLHGPLGLYVTTP